MLIIRGIGIISGILGIVLLGVSLDSDAAKCKLTKDQRKICKVEYSHLPRVEMKRTCRAVFCGVGDDGEDTDNGHDDDGGPIDPGPDNDGSNPSGDWKPEIGDSFTYQITGNVSTKHNVDVYIIDLFDASKADVSKLKKDGRRVVAYFSAGSYEDWRPDAKSFPESVKGKSNGWPGEKWLDISNINTLQPIMVDRINIAREMGFDGIDPDNLDGHNNNTGFNLSAADQIRYNTFIAKTAHSMGLQAGMKNNVEQAGKLSGVFDFAVNEECFQYNECGSLSSFIKKGKPVYQVEYKKLHCSEAGKLKFYHERKTLNLNAKRWTCD